MKPVFDDMNSYNQDYQWKIYKKNMIDLQAEALKMRMSINEIMHRDISNNLYRKLTGQ